MDYKIFTTEFDEVVRPLDLSTPEELADLAKFFHTMCPIDDFEPLRERLEKMVPLSEKTVVSILVDNSGSMHGRPITFAIGVVGIISMYLDRMRIPNEILGFTTSTWKGKARDKWIGEGEPLNPGRVSDLRHIVYKQFNEQLADVRNNLALMLREGLLKENVDGEALLWAVERLREQDAERRILLVISDGAPQDDSTLHQRIGYDPLTKKRLDKGPLNGNWDYLKDHLLQVVNEIDQAGDIQLDAIGIAHDVSEYYQVGDQVDRLEELAPVAIRKLEKMLS